MAATLRVNTVRVERAIGTLARALDGLRGRNVSVLGLSFKAGTDDLRGAPALRFIELLKREGALVTVHDPMALENFRESPASLGVHCKSHIQDAVSGADAVAVMTAWPQYKALSPGGIRAAMRGNVLFDGANMFDPSGAAAAGLRYSGIGRNVSYFTELHEPQAAHVPA